MGKKESHTFYNYQFKYTAVKLLEHPNIQGRSVAEALDIHPIMLYRWKKEMVDGKIENNGKDVRSSRMYEEALKKVKKLEAENQRLRDENIVLKKAERLFTSKKVERFRLIKEHSDRCSIALLCRKLGVSRSGYYAWMKCEESSVEQRMLGLSPKSSEFTRKAGVRMVPHESTQS